MTNKPSRNKHNQWVHLTEHTVAKSSKFRRNKMMLYVICICINRLSNTFLFPRHNLFYTRLKRNQLM